MRRTLLGQEDGAEVTSVGEDHSNKSIFLGGMIRKGRNRDGQS